MKKIISLLLVLVLLVSCLAGCGSSSQTRLESVLESGVLTVATSPDYAPYEFLDENNNPVGADISVAQYIADYIGVELVVEAMDFDACQTAVYAGSVDMAISGFAYTEERANNANLSNTYKFDSTMQGLIVPIDLVSSYTTASDFDGKLIAVQNGSLQQTMTAEQLPNATAEIVTDTNNGILALATGKVDAFATSDDVGLEQLKNYPDLAFCDFWFEYDDDGTVVLMQKGEDDLTAIVNEALAAAEAEGLLEGWLVEAQELVDSLK